jgi:hypothetical protein
MIRHEFEALHSNNELNENNGIGKRPRKDIYVELPAPIDRADEYGSQYQTAAQCQSLTFRMSRGQPHRNDVLTISYP